MIDFLMIIFILIIFSMIVFGILYLIMVVIPSILEKTILKKRVYKKTLEKVKYNLGYNQEMIKFYKGEINTVSEKYKNENCICYCFKDWDYPKQIGIDEELLQQGIKSEEEANKWGEIYSEKKRKEDIQARLKFIEEELKDIKTRI